MTGTFHKDVFTFMTISRRILLRMRNVVEKINTHIFMLKLLSFFFENGAVYQIMSKNVVEPEAIDDSIIRLVRFASSVNKATRAQAPAHASAPANPHTRTHAHTHIAFLRQQWLRERASVLRYTYIACPVWDMLFGNLHKSNNKNSLDMSVFRLNSFLRSCERENMSAVKWVGTASTVLSHYSS